MRLCRAVLAISMGTPSPHSPAQPWDTVGHSSGPCRCLGLGRARCAGVGIKLGGSTTCQLPGPRLGHQMGQVGGCQPRCWGCSTTAMCHSGRAGLDGGYRVGRAACALLPASDSACPPPRGHLCNGLSTEKQQSNPSRALLGCQLPFL